MAKKYSSTLWDAYKDDYKFKPIERCYHTHPGLAVGPGGEWHIYGGNCGSPIVQDADLYVALQAGSTSGLIGDPWDDNPVVEIQFGIGDCMPPKATELPRFQNLITYVCNQLQSGRKVHVGCIGGHGRTGMVLAAVAAELGLPGGSNQVIQYVRAHYCAKAVESAEQVDFLVKHYGVAPAGASHGTYSTEGHTKRKGSSTGTGKGKQEELSGVWADTLPVLPAAKKSKDVGKRTVLPVNSPRNLFKDKKPKKD